MDEVRQWAPTSVTNLDVLLRDHFIEYVCEVKRLVRESPPMSMLEARAAAIQWEREGRPSECGRSTVGVILARLCVPYTILGPHTSQHKLGSPVLSWLSLGKCY